MTLPLYQVDAFASQPFAGNPAAIMPLQAWLPGETMQAIAAENNLAETAFLVATPGGDGDYLIRWFTPTVEVALCGHATLAAAHVVYAHLGHTRADIRFTTLSAGTLVVSRDAVGRINLDFPAYHVAPAALPGLAEALGAVPQAVLHHGGYWLARFADAAAVAALAPDMAALKRLDAQVMATAPGTDCDFVSRFFAPSVGIDEDPVTGSAHCRLIPYWAAELGKTALFARQISRRGGELWCHLRGDRVDMAGHAIEVMRGAFLL